MSNYGIHPTRYGQLSNEALYGMYRQAVYSNLNENEKLDLLQETVNRDAMIRGELGSPQVKFANMRHNISGDAANGVIRVNRDMAVKGIQTMEYNGRTLEHVVDDYNVQALNTVLHENAHCFQDQIIDGSIRINDAQLTAEYQANSFATSVVRQGQSCSLGSHYLTGETPGGYHLYYFQATERDAFLEAEKKTDEILKGIIEKHGFEPSFAAYAKSVMVNGYQAQEREAVKLFNNPNFVKDLNQTLVNQYFGTNKMVNPETEKAVKAEMVETMKTMMPQMASGNITSLKGGETVGFTYKPVTVEEYNQTLRDTVNAYYTHAMNDPAVSTEDALKSTGEVAESYLQAVEEFQTNQDVEVDNDGLDDGCEDDLDI